MNVAFWFDATSLTGAGHAMRCIALARQFVTHGHNTFFFGNVSIPWVEKAIRQLGQSKPQPLISDLPRALENDNLDSLIVDSYTTPRETLEVASGAVNLFEIVDEFPKSVDKWCKIYPYPTSTPHLISEFLLAGDDFIITRGLAQKRTPASLMREPRKVLITTGASSMPSLQNDLLELVAQCMPKADVTIFTDQPGQINLEPIAGTDIKCELVPLGEHLRQAANECDVLITAAGSSVWDFLEAGIPCAIVQAIENQSTVAAICEQLGVAVTFKFDGVGNLLTDNNFSNFKELLDSYKVRLEYSKKASSLVDGEGANRIMKSIVNFGRGKPC